MMTHISVIVPIYNVEKYLERCLLSLFNQTKTDRVEYILVNDGSTDESITVALKIIDRFKHLNITVFNKHKNEGLSAARQTGVNIANGEYILHIDSDDWCENNMLEQLWGIASTTHDDIIVCDYFKNNPTKEYYINSSLPKNPIDCIRIFSSDEKKGSVWNKLFKKKLYSSLDETNLNNINMWEDYYLCYRLFFYADSVYYFPKAFLHYMRDNEYSISTYITEKNKRDILEVIKKLSLFNNSNVVNSPLLKEALFERKLIAKSLIVFSDENTYISEYFDLFSETNSYILKSKALTFSKKILLFLVSKDISKSIFDIIYTLRKYLILILK